jgi:hypothetical protein
MIALPERDLNVKLAQDCSAFLIAHCVDSLLRVEESLDESIQKARGFLDMTLLTYELPRGNDYTLLCQPALTGLALLGSIPSEDAHCRWTGFRGKEAHR